MLVACDSTADFLLLQMPSLSGVTTRGFCESSSVACFIIALNNEVFVDCDYIFNTQSVIVPTEHLTTFLLRKLSARLML